MLKFDPVKTEKSVIYVRMPESMLNEIDLHSGKRDISRNEFILRCIEFSLKHLTDTEKE